VAQVFSRVRTELDIVLVDQRGTGELSPFDCQLDEAEMLALEEQDPDFEELMAIQLGVLESCLTDMDAAPQYYTTDIAMRDLDSIRNWLGYPVINLWGASYGSRAALAYLQTYPDNTRTTIIDAIAPPSLSLPLYNERDASASLAQILDDCANDITCNTAFPELSGHYSELRDRLQTPQAVSLLNDDDFRPIDTTIEAYEFLGFLRQVLYSREAQRLIPLIIEQAWQGNYRPVFALASQYTEDQINQGMFLSVICNEDYTLLTDELLAEQRGNDYLVQSAMFNRFILEACEIWPRREVPASYFEPVTQDRPVLIFSGALDPITPPVWGELVDASLPDSLHLVLEGFGDGTLFTQCTAGIMTDFIESGSLEGLETDCINQFRRRPFFATPGGSGLPDD
jgi:pimeloyl-ACP methyl ester carboxylesterase